MSTVLASFNIYTLYCILSMITVFFSNDSLISN
nr:MAG TPA_asm: hypothetical protein [Bacteriophage sp.]